MAYMKKTGMKKMGGKMAKKMPKLKTMRKKGMGGMKKKKMMK